MLDDLIFRIRALFRRARAESDLDDELRFHLERETEKYQAAGMSREEATRRARLALGGLDQTKEICRDARGVNWIETIARDIRRAARVLLARPLFTATVIISLSLGIGANVAIFSLLRVALWKPLPVEHPEQIVHLQRPLPEVPGEEYSDSYMLFRELRDAARPDAEVFAKAETALVKFGLDAESRERATGEAATANYFAVLGVRPFLGRLFQPDDDSINGGRRVAVLSYRFWAERFQSDPSALGKTVFYKETPYTIVGVAEPGFNGVDAQAATDIWVPVTADVPKNWLPDVHTNWLRLLARVPPGVNRRQLASKLDDRFRAHVRQQMLPGLNAHYKRILESQRLILLPASSGFSTLGRRYEEPLLILMGVVALVLLICCANVANLVMSRNRARQTEIAVRRALGASRSRIASQLFVESLMLSLAGTVSGLLLAIVATRLLISLLPPSQPPLAFDETPDLSVFAFAAALGLATALLFGLLPALRASDAHGANEIVALRSGARVSGRSFAGKLLVVGQLALSLLLVIGAGLFLNTIRNLKAIDLGFQPANVTTFSLVFPKSTPSAHIKQTFDGVRQKLAHLPGILDATWVWPGIYGYGGLDNSISIEGLPTSASEDNEAAILFPGPDFFQVMRMTFVRGRPLDATDMDANPPVAVVNESLARHYFGDASPLGRVIRLSDPAAPPYRIVGLVHDAKHWGARAAPWRTIYLPSFRQGSFLVRTSLAPTTANPASLAFMIRGVVSSVDTSAQVEQIRSVEGIVDDMASRERMTAALSAFFGVVALLLSAIGLFGVMAYNVARRTSELGIRLALGAQRSDVQWMILRETMILVLAGTGIGAAAASVFTRFVSGMLYGVKPADPHIFAGAIFVLALTGAVAGFLPAWRASRIDPVVSLRYE